MAFPAIILGAIASAVIGKFVGKALESGDQKSCSADPFQLLFNKLTSDKTTDTVAAASPSSSPVALPAKKEAAKDNKLASADPKADVSSLVAALENQRIQSQTLLPTFQITNDQQVCEVPRTNGYVGTGVSSVGLVDVPETIKVHATDGQAMNAQDVQRVMKSELISPQAIPAAKEPAQLKAAYGAVSAHAPNGHSFKVSG